MCIPALVTSDDEGNLETLSVCATITNKNCLSSLTSPPPPSRVEIENSSSKIPKSCMTFRLLKLSSIQPSSVPTPLNIVSHS